MKTVRIGHLDFKIVEMNKVPAHEFYGLYLADPQEIQLGKDMTPRRRGEILLHEILHGVADMMNLQLKEDEERIVRSMALGLAQVIRDNQKIFTEIVKALK
jgi:hypothetical protein